MLFIIIIFNRLWDCPEGGSSNPGSDAVSLVAYELEKIARAMQSLYIPAKPPDWLIREAEKTLENNIRGP